MNTLVVKPQSARLEILGVVVTVSILLVIGGVAVSQRQRVDTMPRIYDWQISAFYELNETDQAIYASLNTAVDELWWLHNDKLAYSAGLENEDLWPTVQELGEYYVLPPFPRDLFWQMHGEVQWQRIASFSFEGSTVYFGNGGAVPGQSAYLINLSHIHKGASYVNGATIWMHPDPNVAAPETVVRDSLIKNGWKEVVPYSGAMEVDRIRGFRR